jgi:hypothetical protein
MRGYWPAMVLLFIATSLMCAQTGPQSSTGRIAGTVLNEEGQFAERANVCTSITHGNTTSINCQHALTDKDGRFHMEKVEFGTYALFAINEGEGYSIANQSPGQKVRVTAENPWASVTIRLRPGGGVLIGSVRDKITGEPLKTAINLQYIAPDGEAAGNTRKETSGDGEFRATVPTGLDLLIVVSAPGYKGWVYTDPSDASRPVLRLQPGEHRSLEVEMEPKTQP